MSALVGALAIVTLWFVCGVLVSVLYVTKWVPNAATETSHRNNPQRPASGSSVPVRLHQDR